MVKVVKKISIIDHVARAMKHHDSVSEIMKSRALSDEELHMLMFLLNRVIT